MARMAEWVGASEITLHLPGLRRYARALLRDPNHAEDLVQDTVMRAWEKRYHYRPDTNLRAWLFTIMHNVYVNKLRRDGLESRIMRSGEVTEGDLPGTPDPDPVSFNDLENALQQLTPDQREVLLLAGLEHMSYKEIATTLGIPLGTVMSRLGRARERLRHLLSTEPATHTV